MIRADMDLHKEGITEDQVDHHHQDMDPRHHLEDTDHHQETIHHREDTREDRLQQDLLLHISDHLDGVQTLYCELLVVVVFYETPGVRVEGTGLGSTGKLKRIC